MIALLLLAQAPADFFPCTPGLAIEYRLADAEGKVTGSRVDTVRGPGKQPNTCVYDRLERQGDREDKDAWVLERLSDRVLNAGWLSMMTAFRPPLLMAPLEQGRRWHFDRVDYRVMEAGSRRTIGGQTFGPCVRVHERATDDSGHHGESTYCAGLGLVEYIGPKRHQVAIRVRRG